MDLVDGNNVMGRLGAPERESLLAELTEIARRKGKKLTVVFDGPPASGRPKVQALGDVTVVYAAPRSADEEIVRRIREARDARAVTVVTDDRALAGAAASAGARVAGVETFRRDAEKRLGTTAPAETAAKSVPGYSARNWEAWFADPRNRTGA